jgi:hypothetical protein
MEKPERGTGQNSDYNMFPSIHTTPIPLKFALPGMSQKVTI